MKELFIENGITITDEIAEKFEKYYNLLIEYNEKFNITAITEKREVYIKHFIDSILNVKIESGTLIDIGSGGGFPALPIAITNENVYVTMIEATEKKCGFLQTVINELNLKNAFVICGRAEDFAKNKEFREKFDYCSARAVARLNILCEYTLPFLKVGGRSIFFKGDAKEELSEAKNAIKVLGCKLVLSDEFLLEDAKRTLIYVEKEKATDIKYPRQNSQIRKKPL